MTNRFVIIFAFVAFSTVMTTAKAQTCFVGSNEDPTACMERYEEEGRQELMELGIAKKSAISPSGKKIVCQVFDLEDQIDDPSMLAEKGHNCIISYNGYILLSDTWLVKGRHECHEAVRLMRMNPVCNGRAEPPK